VKTRHWWLILAAVILGAMVGAFVVVLRERASDQTVHAVAAPTRTATPATAASPANWPPRDETPELFPGSQRVVQLSEGRSQAAVLTTDAQAGGQASLWLIDWNLAAPKATEIFGGGDPKAVAPPIWIQYDTALLYQFSAGDCSGLQKEACGIYTLTPASGKKDKLLDHRTTGLAFSPNSGEVAFWDYTTGDKLTIFDMFKKQVIRSWSDQPHAANDFVAREMAFSPDGKSLYARLYDQGTFALKEFNLQSGQVKLVRPSVIGPVAASDGVYFIDLPLPEAGTEQKSGRLMRIPAGGSQPVEVVSSFPYERLDSNFGLPVMVAYGSDSGLLIYDVGTQSGYTAGKNCQFVTFLRGGSHYVVDNKLVGDSKDCGVPSRSPFWGPQMREKLAQMKSLHEQIAKAGSPHEQASAWFELNDAAGELAGMINGSTRLFPAQFEKLAETAGRLGVELRDCEISAQWGVISTGYEKYLELWPDGPRADDAWWHSRLESWCGDFEGSAEEYQAAADHYAEFLKRFPNSPRAGEARKALQENLAGLADEREEEKARREKKQPKD
jgi:hypothetical protein